MKRLAKTVSAILSRALGDEFGNFVIAFSLVTPMIMGAAGLGIDMSSMSGHRAQLQEAADAAAIATAKELPVSGGDSERLKGIAENVVRANLNKAPASKAEGLRVETTVDLKAKTVTVSVSQDPVQLLLGELVGFEGPLSAQAKGTVTGTTNICVIALEDNANKAFEVKDQSVLDAPSCALFSNSTHNNGLHVTGNSQLLADLVCTAGGYSGPAKAFHFPPVTDCPATPDPLETRNGPMLGGCDHVDLDVDTNTTLNPGTYCDGLEIKNTANVTFNEGIYIIDGGSFLINNEAVVRGDYVGFYFTGDQPELKFDGDADIELGAPKDGPMAGILFFLDPNALDPKDFEIRTPNARKLLGTIYLPNGVLAIDTTAPVAEESAYTAIVTREIHLGGDARLVLNTDYDLTDVPVPVGLGPQDGKVRLAE